MKLFDHFNFLAPYYDRAIPLAHAEKLIELVELPQSGNLLDAGGGTGRVAQIFSGVASEIVVADLSFQMLQQTAEKGGMLSIRSQSERLPFVDKSFDRVLMVDAFHHVCNHVDTSYEMWRVLRRGGRLVIEEPDVRKMNVKVIAVLEKMALMRSHFINPDRIAALFSYPDSQTKIELDGSNAWVIVEKK